KNGDKIVSEAVSTSTAPAHKVTVHLPDMTESATFECKEDQFILNAALASGVTLPFGCRMASCGMCAGKVVEGKVERAEQLVLTDEQIAQGFAVLCKTMPRSDLTIISHQDSELGV